MAHFEKMMVMALAICAIIYGGYFFTIFQFSVSGTLEMDTVRPLLLKTAALLLGLVTLGSVGLSMIIRKDLDHGSPADERDMRIWTRSGSKTIHILYAGVIIALGLVVFEFSPLIVTHVLLATVAVTDITRLVLMLTDYRKDH